MGTVQQATPFVSIIVPCLNEAATIRSLLAAIQQQTYPHTAMEVIIADGGSSDGTRTVIAQCCAELPDLRIMLIDNPERIIPAALNHALRASSGDIIVRLDAHSAPYPTYVQRCVEALQAGSGSNVGGVWEIQPGGKTAIARGIAAAAGHPLGVGDARYRYATSAGSVDTVPFGAFWHSLIEQIGMFDQRLETNEDYEFNVRVRQHGGIVWLDPSIRAIYYARPTLVALARQYWRYGFWKQRMLRQYPETLRWRQALPPLFTAGLVGMAMLALRLKPARWLFLLILLLYQLPLLIAGIRAGIRRQEPALLFTLPAAITTMHLSWGSGFLWSMLTYNNLWQVNEPA